MPGTRDRTQQEGESFNLIGQRIYRNDRTRYHWTISYGKLGYVYYFNRFGKKEVIQVRVPTAVNPTKSDSVPTTGWLEVDEVEFGPTEDEPVSLDDVSFEHGIGAKLSGKKLDNLYIVDYSRGKYNEIVDEGLYREEYWWD